ncbi:electron transfer flavoprotein alpha subunit apoprotein [Peptoniphilus asaccharolyticus DSM 20463]|uniref:Electron transfer flavoprotein alpha subunit apoprotein n=1 Tax=Peptoniphilus asaccharolyticus DSM 20463 TaxID=573058 RepID=A0A1W1UHM1_PEPAS|nr:electron transfer flavoprotein subunit alpha/FixB family protein [Peptoniphilus asaccharolyticus]MBL7574735.1 electron transfer flavoprotein subunit alpha/FixB family protein [Peptoniphilus asaccharolyticus]SMB80577.1 electron transfer flavoprotein alpha subunit apoprotein [Peptoniphilus asaccharolyticus DSM 20463]
MSKDVYVFIEQRDNKIQKVGIELLGKARELADALGQEVVGILLGESIKSETPVLFKHGADKVITVEDPMLKEYVTEPYAKAIFEVIKENSPEIVLYGATSIGRDLAPRLAARIHTGLTADCTKLDIDEETKNLLMTRPAFGGNIMATIICEDFRPQMATVRPGVMQSVTVDNPKSEVIEKKVEFTDADMNVTIREIKKSESKKKDITEANILVSGGRGLGGPEGFDELDKLAKELDAEISSSRAAVDAGWIAKDRQVGQTGKTVRPELYFAMGISGAIQHLAGMEDSDLIIAVNKTEDAPIFDVADLGVVGDINAIVPKLVDIIKKEKALKEEIK